MRKIRKFLKQLYWLFTLSFRSFDEVDGKVLRITPRTAWEVGEIMTKYHYLAGAV